MKYLKASVIYKVFSQLLRRWRSRLYVFLVFSEGTIAYHRRLKIPSVMSISCIITSGPKGTNTKRRLAALTHPECGATALSLSFSLSLFVSLSQSQSIACQTGGESQVNGTCQNAQWHVFLRREKRRTPSPRGSEPSERTLGRRV